MQLELIKSLFLKHQETSLKHRYITNKHIRALVRKTTRKNSMSKSLEPLF